MPELFTLLLKINLVLILFSVAYYLVLRRLTFYSINRLFLVFGILFSTAYPFIDLTDFFHSQKQINYVAFVPGLNHKVNNLVPTNFVALHWQIISLLFYIGVGVMALRLIFQFLSLYLMHRKSKPGAVDNYPVRILTDAVSPFSFWQTVYVNPSLHQEQELKTILAHEHIHVKEWHSLDIILAELSVVFYWFNPGVWLMKKAVKENLEFITDQKILNNGIDKKTYQYSLLDVGNLTPAVAIVNNFNISDLKKRIKMMNVKRSSRLTLSRYLLITPFLLITTLAFTISKKDIKKHLVPLQNALAEHQLFKDTTAIYPVAIKKSTKRTKLILTTKAQPDTAGKLTRIYNAIFISTDSTKKEISNTMAQIAALMQMRGKALSDSSVKSVTIVRTAKLNTDQNDNQPVKILAPKGENGKLFLQGFKVTGINISDQAGSVTNEPGKATITFRGRPGTDTANNSNIVYFVNGKKVTAEQLRQIDVGTIKSVDVVKKNSGDPIVVIGRKTP